MNTKDLTYKHIIRNFNISILTESEIKGPFYSIYKELKYIFSNLNIYKSEVYPYVTYYGKSREDLYMRYDSKKEDILLDNGNVWSKFESKHNLSYECIQGITTWYLEHTFQMKGNTNFRNCDAVLVGLEHTFQMKGNTNTIILNK